MAKLDWDKNRQNRILNQQRFKDSHNDFFRFLNKGIWPVKGKHLGKKITDLDIGYLHWIKKNFNGPLKNTVINEIQRRKNLK